VVGDAFIYGTRFYLGASDTFRQSFHGNPGYNLQIETAQSVNNMPVEVDLITNNSVDNGTASVLAFSRSRSSSVGGVTAIDAGDNLGRITFTGADGTNLYPSAAGIVATAEGTFTTSNSPGYLTFLTTPSGSSNALAERMRIDSDGNVGIGTTSPGAKLEVNGKVAVGGSCAQGDLCIAQTNSVGPGGAVYIQNPGGGDCRIWTTTAGACEAGTAITTGSTRILCAYCD